jgi:hypothetical protein
MTSHPSEADLASPDNSTILQARENDTAPVRGPSSKPQYRSSCTCLQQLANNCNVISSHHSQLLSGTGSCPSEVIARPGTLVGLLRCPHWPGWRHGQQQDIHPRYCHQILKRQRLACHTSTMPPPAEARSRRPLVEGHDFHAWHRQHPDPQSTKYLISGVPDPAPRRLHCGNQEHWCHQK